MPDWRGQTAVLIGGGPSLKPEQISVIRGRARILAINDAYRLAPHADVLYACDPGWWAAHNGVPGFHGEKWTQDRNAARTWALKCIKSAPRKGLSRDPKVIHQGCNSGYQALNLAVLWGAKRIILLGYDMRPGPNGERHWFGDHAGAMNKGHGYRAWIKYFETAVPDLKKLRVEVINCSADTALTCFPRANIKDFFA